MQAGGWFILMDHPSHCGKDLDFGQGPLEYARRHIPPPIIGFLHACVCQLRCWHFLIISLTFLITFLVGLPTFLSSPQSNAICCPREERMYPPPLLPRNQQCFAVCPTGDSWTVFSSQKVLWNQGLVLVHGHEQPCTAETAFSDVLHRGMYAISFLTVRNMNE